MGETKPGRKKPGANKSGPQASVEDLAVVVARGERSAITKALTLVESRVDPDTVALRATL